MPNIILLTIFAINEITIFFPLTINNIEIVKYNILFNILGLELEAEF